ncbi:hypothetical protein E2C01_013761 [Portunus trituberculatus]|uniref:Uncharacterized protein n=1 Tax=Portunus trituberculatus TaxID=210409 RepID=A0A5B7DH37_PORTR|nr:hypothetical protein [Portunus trituberculatus]
MRDRVCADLVYLANIKCINDIIAVFPNVSLPYTQRSQCLEQVMVRSEDSADTEWMAVTPEDCRVEVWHFVDPSRGKTSKLALLDRLRDADVAAHFFRVYYLSVGAKMFNSVRVCVCAAVCTNLGT